MYHHGDDITWKMEYHEIKKNPRFPGISLSNSEDTMDKLSEDWANIGNQFVGKLTQAILYTFLSSKNETYTI